MKIKVDVVIEMTPEQAEAYAADYGLGASDVRADVRSHVRTLVQESAAATFWTVSVKEP